MKFINENLIQVTCTACIRPEILDVTFSSFNSGLLNQFEKKELFINIDPVGNPKNSIEDILLVCNKYFDHVVWNTPQTGDFSKATKWVWEQVTADYFLHLEDDWLLNKRISKIRLLSTLFAEDQIASVRLNRQTSIKNKVLDRVSLNPILFKTAFIKKALEHFNEEIDPEKQFSINPLKDYLGSYTHLAYGILKGKYIEGAYVTDIGRYWRNAKGFKKSFHGQKFTWKKENLVFVHQIKSWIFFKTLSLRKKINSFR